MSLSSGSSGSCALLDDAGIKCWGSNAAGQLGGGTVYPMGDRLPYLDLGTF